MISEDSLQKISHLFCGDTGEKFAYKSGPKLVSFSTHIFQQMINMKAVFHPDGFMCIISWWIF